jgi:hypothetical protein
MSRSRYGWKPCVCPVDFDRVNRAALARSRELVPTLLPGGVTTGHQYVIPRLNDPGIVSIFRDRGNWSDSEVVAHGDDAVGLIAYSLGISQRDAAQLIARWLDIDWRRRR